MALALKEWSVIVDALGKGRQSILLRKGGISETEGEFTVQGNKFLLFPTRFHEAPLHIKENWQPYLNGDRYFQDGKMKIEFYAEVAQSSIVKDWIKFRNSTTGMPGKKLRYKSDLNVGKNPST